MQMSSTLASTIHNPLMLVFNEGETAKITISVEMILVKLSASSQALKYTLWRAFNIIIWLLSFLDGIMPHKEEYWGIC